MKIAIISDVHGNLPALKQVLSDAHDNNVDRFIFAGDYIFDFSFSNEVVQTIMDLDNAYVIKGNKETYINRLRHENQQDWIYEQMGVIYQTYRELSTSATGFLTSLESELFVPLDTGEKIYAVHYPKGISKQLKTACGSASFHKKMLAQPFMHDEFLSEFSEILNGDEWKNAVKDIDASVIVFGHDHLQRFGYCGDKLVINPGSCGLPLDFNNNAPYTILEQIGNGFNVIERRVAYDIKAVISAAMQSPIYSCGTIWCELCFMSLRTGRDFFGIFFDIAKSIASAKNEQSFYFTNQTWNDAYKSFKTLGHCIL